MILERSSRKDISRPCHRRPWKELLEFRRCLAAFQSADIRAEREHLSNERSLTMNLSIVASAFARLLSGLMNESDHRIRSHGSEDVSSCGRVSKTSIATRNTAASDRKSARHASASVATLVQRVNDFSPPPGRTETSSERVRGPRRQVRYRGGPFVCQAVILTRVTLSLSSLLPRGGSRRLS